MHPVMLLIIYNNGKVRKLGAHCYLRKTGLRKVVEIINILNSGNTQVEGIA
jgi:hypothetical protein